MANFRSSGRFFWPVTYGLMAMLILLTARRFAERTTVCLLAGCALLQVYDQHVLPRIGVAPSPVYAQPENIARWLRLVRAFSSLEVQPAFYAGNWEPFDTYLIYIAARANLPINSVYNTRHPTNCDDEFIAADHPFIRPGRLYIFVKSDYSLARLTQLLDNQHYVLKEADNCYVVAAAWPPDFLAQNADFLRSPTLAPLLALSAKTKVDFSGYNDLTGVSFTGLYNSEPWGRWSRGKVTEISTGLDPSLQGHALILHGKFIPYLDATHQHLVVDITVNGQAAGTWKFSITNDKGGPVERTVTVPASATSKGTLDCHFYIHDPVDALLDYGNRRNVGLGFVEFSVAEYNPKLQLL